MILIQIMGGNLLRFLLSQLFKFSKLKKTFIVAEIGVNHEGDFNKALDLIKKADEAGVDAVMISHVNAPGYQFNADIPATLSKFWVTEILKDSLGYKLLI